MSYFANCLAKCAMLLINLCLIGIAAVAFMQYAKKEDMSKKEKNGYLILGIVMILCALIYNMLLCCFKTAIEVAIAVIDGTADFLASTKRIIFVSLVYFIITFVFIILWFLCVACVLALSEIHASSSIPQGKTFVTTKAIKIMIGFMIFGLIWLIFFI